MIQSFRHRGLKRFFEKKDSSKLPPDMVNRIWLILTALDASVGVGGMNLPTFHLHPLKGDLKNYYAVTVRGNWRIIFQFKGDDAFDVDFGDYH